MLPLDLIHSYLMSLENGEDKDQQEWDGLVEARDALLAKGAKATHDHLIPACFKDN